MKSNVCNGSEKMEFIKDLKLAVSTVTRKDIEALDIEKLIQKYLEGSTGREKFIRRRYILVRLVVLLHRANTPHSEVFIEMYFALNWLVGEVRKMKKKPK